ncbi:MAG: peptidase M42, partial [Verrucomicrobia bacterium 21-51-4]
MPVAKKTSSAKKPTHTHTMPDLLAALLHSRAPSGYEAEAHAVLDRFMKPVADVYEKDVLGNRYSTLNPKGDPCLMLAGHMDELGFIITYIDDKGFIYFDTIGGHDVGIIPGRRIRVLTEKGDIAGVTGKRAIHLMTAEDRKKVPELHDLWIDIGAKSKKEALELVRIGDAMVYDVTFEVLRGSLVTSRAFDDRAGCYVVNEVLRRLAKKRSKLQAKVVSVSTVQEEIGTRGAVTSGYHANPNIAIAVDVSHATDHPNCDPKRFGEFKLGGGPILTRGPNINPKVFKKLEASAQALKIPYQLEADPRPTGTDARSIQMARSGVATA